VGAQTNFGASYSEVWALASV